MTQSTIQLAGICNLLGRLWLQEVTTETIKALQTDSFRLPYEELGGFVPASSNDAMVHSLAVEYCELLIGPKGHISPIQSVWVDQQLQSTTSSSMHRFFELVPEFEIQESFPDHLGVQLAFVGALLSQSGSAKHEILEMFIDKHLKWTGNMLDEVVRRPGSEFYQGLAVVTAALIELLPETVAGS